MGNARQGKFISVFIMSEKRQETKPKVYVTPIHNCAGIGEIFSSQRKTLLGQARQLYFAAVEVPDLGVG